MEPLLFGGPVTFVTGAAGLTFGAPLLEETSFRGILYPTLRKFLPPLPAMIGIGIFFGVQHPYGLAGMAATAVMGAWAACVYEVTRSLWPSFVLHALNNGVAMLLVALLAR